MAALPLRDVASPLRGLSRPVYRKLGTSGGRKGTEPLPYRSSIDRRRRPRRMARTKKPPSLREVARRSRDGGSPWGCPLRGERGNSLSHRLRRRQLPQRGGLGVAPTEVVAFRENGPPSTRKEYAASVRRQSRQRLRRAAAPTGGLPIEEVWGPVPRPSRLLEPWRSRK